MGDRGPRRRVARKRGQRTLFVALCGLKGAAPRAQKTGQRTLFVALCGLKRATPPTPWTEGSGTVFGPRGQEPFSLFIRRETVSGPSAAARRQRDRPADGPTGPTSEELWQARPTLTLDQRTLFQATVTRNREEIRTREGHPQEESMSTSKERLMDRETIRRALGERGYLLFSRRRIPLRFNQHKTADIM